MDTLDPHQRPPEGIRNIYKKYQKMKSADLDQDAEIVDIERDVSGVQRRKISIVKEIAGGELANAFGRFTGESDESGVPTKPIQVYEHEDMPGLHILPSLLPPELQHLLLTRLFHRDLSNPTHLTNIHTHYNITYPPPTTLPSTPFPAPASHSSFFSLPPSTSTPIACPIDPSIHKSLTITQFLSRKLRWMTLGGQYDWTSKRYPSTPPPPFPADIKALLESIFIDTKAEAAIVNLYSPGDTLSVHRDVAESCSTGLISISLGCDAIFVIGTEGGNEGDGRKGKEKVLALRLKSGSAVYMSGESRFAWHGVPQIVKDTCPEYLSEWPAGAKDGKGGEYGDGDRQFEEWRGWMRGKRVNLNVRQMWDG